MKPRLHYRLLAWNLLLAGITILALDFIVSSAVRGHLREQVRDDLRRETALAKDYLERLAGGEPSDEIADRLSSLLSLRVTLIAPDGRVLGDSERGGRALQEMENHAGRPEVVDAVQSGTGTATRYSTTVGIDFMYTAVSYPGGIVRLAMPLTQVDRTVRNLRARLYSASVIGLAFILLFAYTVALRISRPIRDIAQGAQQLAKGDLSQRFPTRGEDEISSLGRSLNTMAETLSAKLEELSTGKHRLELIVGAIGEGVMVLDRDGRVQLVNGSVRRLLGIRQQEPALPYERALEHELLRAAVRAVLDGADAKTLELGLAAGRVFRATVTPVRDESGALQVVVLVFNDLTSIRRTEQMRKDFVSNVSHEFKTPLTSIRGYTETLLSGAVEDPAMRQSFLRVIDSNAQHLESLVRDLLTLSKLEAELPATREPIDVQALVREHLSSRQTALTERAIQVSVECPPLVIRADRSRLAAAVSNLIDNAVNYNRPGGRVEIRAQLNDEGEFLLDVSDSGYGIPENEVGRVFERFYRIDKARSRNSGGTGLGLSIAKHAVESQGGRILVSSRPGEGSTFTIRLKAVAD